MNEVKVIGAGLAGCEAAWQLANRDVNVKLYEMKPKIFSPAHSSPNFAELVCSNSFKADRVESAAGLLKEEMRRLGSLIMMCADKSRVPAGGALAVDREKFSSLVTDKIKSHPKIKVVEERIEDFSQDEITIVATGPLTQGKLADRISNFCGGFLNFYDAAAPIVTAESIDMNYTFSASRYDRGGESDYINCPMSKDEFERFHAELVKAERAPLHEFDVQDKKVYEGCMPIEVMAKRGLDTIRFGPMKPVGLRDPKTGHRPWAVLQLRKENEQASLYNLVGFQTNLKFQEQKRVFGMINALRDAQFVRFGVMHRNTFIDSPRVLCKDLSLKDHPSIFFAGQITGVEGYMESTSSGLLAGLNVFSRLKNKSLEKFPSETMIGSLNDYVVNSASSNFQPMGANFGILPESREKIRDKKERYKFLAERSINELSKYISKNLE